MRISKTDIMLEINVDTKTDLTVLVNKLLEHSITTFLITEDKVSLRSNVNDVMSSSTLTNGYVLTIHCISVNVFNVLTDLNLII